MSSHGTLVLRSKNVVPERLITDEMGYEVVTLYVGEKEVVFNIHKKLIAATSAPFSDIFRTALLPGQKHLLKEVDPDAFKLFVEFLYSRRIPAVTASMDAAVMALRTKQLCQFYAFCDKYYLKFEIRNQIMDHIQDAFLIMNKLPEPGLVQAIYANSTPDSKLRSFALAGAYYGYRHDKNAKREDFKKLLHGNYQLLDDFLELDRAVSVDHDPRVRQCYGWEGCAECANHVEGHARIEGLGGVFPCEFHIHQGIMGRLKEGSDGPNGTNTEYVEFSDDGCYLWDSFPDFEWMKKYGSKLS